MKQAFRAILATFAALLLALAARAAPPRADHDAGSTAESVSDTHALWRQMKADMGIGVLSQNFESPFDNYDIAAADDFKVPKAHEWVIDEVDVVGHYIKGTGPARSEQVTFYADDHGLPGAVVATYEVVGTHAGTGSFLMTIPKTTLQPGVYWLSVVANMDFAVGGEWYWEMHNGSRLGHGVQQNPGGGFGVCTTWCNYAGSGDEMFVLKGRERPVD